MSLTGHGDFTLPGESGRVSLHPSLSLTTHTLIRMQHCSTAAPLTLQEVSHKHGHTGNCQYENSSLGLTRPPSVITDRTWCTVPASLVTAECNDLAGVPCTKVHCGPRFHCVGVMCYHRPHPALTEPGWRGAAAGAAQALPLPPALPS